MNAEIATLASNYDDGVLKATASHKAGEMTCIRMHAHTHVRKCVSVFSVVHRQIVGMCDTKFPWILVDGPLDL